MVFELFYLFKQSLVVSVYIFFQEKNAPYNQLLIQCADHLIVIL